MFRQSKFWRRFCKYKFTLYILNTVYVLYTLNSIVHYICTYCISCIYSYITVYRMSESERIFVILRIKLQLFSILNLLYFNLVFIYIILIYYYNYHRCMSLNLIIIIVIIIIIIIITKYYCDSMDANVLNHWDALLLQNNLKAKSQSNGRVFKKNIKLSKSGELVLTY